ncbi:MAG: sugar fermentation stimulation protein SfsA [Bacteroidetes bacterium GWC2_33_15]|nr:MAG: sugar fermentation stimulation protein SfsA [Bacteroidetes bacterium GWA2_33_15]OFX49357.1 MAG: sugar fermentation stimulation protein SfsA [Bacteroidetes bacterium GWC2_33_15]OFX63050.1 MAG: sugar fermentation stimulation protein SfsA [Bacteroidetes bacterium GWB2_32_14]OFX68705.1 MAG: sugar fermentation stimulation protein SfsA [Bacteroidetes bacterium GWD2_33_33]HAN19128.1 DNA/RNA nuclease SfsA [Bacteroidales bacterium]
MNFQKPLIHGYLIKRYMRFLADIKLDSGNIVTAHCTNSGTMKSCLEDNAEVYLSPVDDPNRKTKFTWEMIKINGNWVGINTGNPNKLAYEAVKSGKIEKLKGYTEVQAEVKFDDSRFDLMAKNEKETCFIEVKNVTLKEGKYALFPDAVTSRGKKHLETLAKVKEQGMRAVMLYVIQRNDVEIFAPAKEIDPEYAKVLKIAYEKGVEIIPMQVNVTPEKIELLKELPFEL